MAIRFFCKGCNQLLGIASRKAGTEIECPKCGLAQTVPTEEAAAAAMAMVRSGRTNQEDDEPALPDLLVYDDTPAAIPSAPAPPGEPKVETPGETRRFDTPPASASPVAAPLTAATIEVGEPAPPGTILFPRKVIYLQASIFLVAGAFLFTAGYFIGRGNATVDIRAAQEAASREQVLLDGRLAYNPRPGEIHGDREAVAIALPVDARPDRPLPIQGLRPQDPPPAENYLSIRRIQELGGNYARADAEGRYSMVLPDAGEYHLLVISANCPRKADEEVDEIDLQEMQRYFDQARGLISRFRYRWETRKLEGGAATLDHNFSAAP